MKTIRISFLLLAVTLLALQCEKTDIDPPLGGDFFCEENPTTCELTAANGNFAIDLLKQLNSEEPEDNIFISPFSISTALAMTYNDADGETKAEMAKTL